MVSGGTVQRVLIGDDAHSPIGCLIPIRQPINCRVRLLWIEDVEPHGSGAQHGWDAHLLILSIQREDQGVIARIPESIVDLLLLSSKFVCRCFELGLLARSLRE